VFACFSLELFAESGLEYEDLNDCTQARIRDPAKLIDPAMFAYLNPGQSEHTQDKGEYSAM